MLLAGRLGPAATGRGGTKARRRASPSRGAGAGPDPRPGRPRPFTPGRHPLRHLASWTAWRSWHADGSVQTQVIGIEGVSGRQPHRPTRPQARHQQSRAEASSLRASRRPIVQARTVILAAFTLGAPRTRALRTRPAPRPASACAGSSSRTSGTRLGTLPHPGPGVAPRRTAPTAAVRAERFASEGSCRATAASAPRELPRVGTRKASNWPWTRPLFDAEESSAARRLDGARKLLHDQADIAVTLR